MSNLLVFSISAYLVLGNCPEGRSQPETERLLAGSGRIVAVSFTAKGKEVYLCPESKGLEHWEVESAKKLRSVGEDAPWPFRSPQLTEDGEYLFVTCGDALYPFEPKELVRGNAPGLAGRGLRLGKTAGEPPSAFVLDPKGRFVILGGHKGNMSRFDPKAKPFMANMTSKLDAGEIHAMAMDRSAKSIVVGGDNGRIRTMTTNNMKWNKELEGHQQAVLSLCYDSKGKYVASSSADHTVRVWLSSSGKQKAMLEGHDAPVTAVIFHPDGKHVISGDATGAIKVWEWGKEELTRDLELPEDSDGGVEQLVVSPDRKSLFVAGCGHGLLLWDLKEVIK